MTPHKANVHLGSEANSVPLSLDTFWIPMRWWQMTLAGFKWNFYQTTKHDILCRELEIKQCLQRTAQSVFLILTPSDTEIKMYFGG